jgi:TRAP-type C4-dicarboxylate transport system substrate-binding protein
MKALGARPMMIGAGDIYMSLQKGVVDGLTASGGFMEIFNVYEVTEYWTHIATSTALQTYIMNKQKFESLPKNIQDAIMKESGYEGSRNYTRSYRDPELKPLKAEMAKFIGSGGHAMKEYTVPAEGLPAWQAIAGKPVWDAWVAKMEAQGLPGQAVLDECLKLLETEPA